MENDVVMTMQEDLQRALKKPAADVRWAMLINTRKCVGCHSCTAGCAAENASPPGVLYRPVFEQEEGVYPDVKRTFVSRPCMQCDKAPCVEACPKKGTATRKSAEGVSAGIVVIDYEQCIGCGKCVPACPYKARSMDDGKFHAEFAPSVPDYEKRPAEEYGKAWPREAGKAPIGKARKCHFCLHRVKNGLLPACATTCICGGVYFGDENDPASLIAKAKKANGTTTILSVTDGRPIFGRVTFGASATQPRVYHIL